jgi:hypothetical protein
MAMPPQLARAHRPQKNESTRPIVEQLPSISVNKLSIPSYYDCNSYILPNISFRLPKLSSAKVSFNHVEFHHPSIFRGRPGLTQTFQLKHVKTGFGKLNDGTGIRHAFICACGKPVTKLYYLNGKLACRFCCKARYASQTLNKRTRPVLEATRIQSFLDSRPRLFRRTRERLQKRLGEKIMMAQRRFGTDASGLWD